MKSKYGFQVVGKDNVFKVAAKYGIKPWPHIESKPTVAFKDYIQGDLTDQQKKEVDKFAPQSEVAFLLHPTDGEFTSFRSVGKNFANVFCLLPDDLIVLAIEFKHATEIISISMPAGTPTKEESRLENGMTLCAEREFREETGIKLANLVPLCGPRGYAISPTQSVQCLFPYLGLAEIPVISQKLNLDYQEKVLPVLMPLKEWMEMLYDCRVLNANAIITTHLALNKLRRMVISGL